MILLFMSSLTTNNWVRIAKSLATGLSAARAASPGANPFGTRPGRSHNHALGAMRPSVSLPRASISLPYCIHA